MRIPDFFTVSLTQEHINRGICGDAGNCPVSLALKDSLEKQYDVITTNNGPIILTNDIPNGLMGYTRVDGNVKHLYKFDVDDSMLHTWISMFDDGHLVPAIDIDFQVDNILGEDEHDDDITEYLDCDENTVIHIGEAKIVDECETLDLHEEIYG